MVDTTNMQKLTKKQEEFRDTLRKEGLKATPARIKLLQLFDKTKKPLSIKEIQKALKFEKIDQATLYRVINALKSSNMLHQVDLQHGHDDYELASKIHHHHIICEHCGKIKDIVFDTEDLEKKALRLGGFSTIKNHSLEFFGVCNVCAKK